MEQLWDRSQQALEQVAESEVKQSVLLNNDVGPLLNEIECLLRTSSLPEVDRKELSALKSELHQKTFYSDIIDSDEAAKILNLDPSRVRKLAKQGLLGTSFSRTYVFHRADVERFAQLERPSGNTSSRKN